MDGLQFSGIAAGLAISQQIHGLTPGDTYLLTFKMAAENVNDEGGPGTITVSFPDGSPTGPVSFTSYSDAWHHIPDPVNPDELPGWWWKDPWSIWVEESMTFVASDSSVTLDFSSLDQEFQGLDCVQVNAVPEPGSLAIVAGIVLAASPLAVRQPRRRER